MSWSLPDGWLSTFREEFQLKAIFPYHAHSSCSSNLIPSLHCDLEETVGPAGSDGIQANEGAVLA
jgi:hypothetical protein